MRMKRGAVTPGAYQQNISHRCRGRLKRTAGYGWAYEGGA